MTVLRHPLLPAEQTYETDVESLIEVLTGNGWEPVDPDDLPTTTDPDLDAVHALTDLDNGDAAGDADH